MRNPESPWTVREMANENGQHFLIPHFKGQECTHILRVSIDESMREQSTMLIEVQLGQEPFDQEELPEDIIGNGIEQCEKFTGYEHRVDINGTPVCDSCGLKEEDHV